MTGPKYASVSTWAQSAIAPGAAEARVRDQDGRRDDAAAHLMPAGESSRAEKAQPPVHSITAKTT